MLSFETSVAGRSQTFNKLFSCASSSSQPLLRLLSLQPQPLIGPVKPVQHADAPKVDIEPLVMPVMLSRRAAEEIVAAVHRRSLDQLPRKKHPHGQDVRAQQQGRQRDRQGVGHNVLDRMRILRREGDRRGELVVYLVDALVEVAHVEEPVRIIEECLTHDDADDEVARELGQRGQRRLNADCRRVTLRVGSIGEGEVDGGDEDLVPS